MSHRSSVTQDSRTNLLGNLVVLIEAILSPKSQHFLNESQRKKLVAAIKPIMKHGCIALFDDCNSLWNVILGLRVICPHFWPTQLFKPSPDEESEVLLCRWIELSLECGLLSVQLEKLVAERERIEAAYSPTAFLRSQDHVEALKVVLRALQENSAASLAKINPLLMASYFGSSVPSFQLSACSQSSSFSGEDKDSRRESLTCQVLDAPKLTLDEEENPSETSNLEYSYSFVNSCSTFQTESGDNAEGAQAQINPELAPLNTLYLSSDSADEEEFKYIKPSAFLLDCYARMRERPARIRVPTKSRREQWLSSTTSSSSPCDRMTSTEPPAASKEDAKVLKPLPMREAVQPGPSISPGARGTNFMEDGGHSIMPEADGFKVFPQPGQSLLEFLNFSQLVKSNGQLDRENAHFTVADAVLRAIERMKHQQRSRERRAPSSFYGETDEDSSSAPVRGTRRKLRKASALHFAASDDPATSDHSPLQSSSCSSSDGEGSAPCRQSGDETGSPNTPTPQTDPTSAENVAINILKNYDAQLLPKATDLNWFVSEDDVPQKLLPLPDEVESAPRCESTAIRGTNDWAPPRPQLILTLQKSSKRHAQLCAQSWRCSGCGLKVSEHFSARFRFCHYLGRYFCTSCHTNSKAIIPARVIHKWDFKKYLVSNFSQQLLQCMHEDPLFNVATLNGALYKKSSVLHQIHVYRRQLFHARNYIMACSRATKEKEMLTRSPDHWSSDPHVYSLKDLVAVRDGQLTPLIKRLAVKLITHISGCEGCVGQGFICELCGRDEPIFAFQLDVVAQCTKCKSCYHFLCFSPKNSCPRCARKERRLLNRTQTTN